MTDMSGPEVYHLPLSSDGANECLKLYIYSSYKKSKVHPCTGTEALYRPYGP